MEIPSFSQLARIAPITVIVLMVAGIGFYAAKVIYTEHIKSLKEFIEYLKRNN